MVYNLLGGVEGVRQTSREGRSVTSHATRSGGRYQLDAARFGGGVGRSYSVREVSNSAANGARSSTPHSPHISLLS